MTIFLISMGIGVFVMAGFFGFGYFVLKSLSAGFQERYPFDFLLCLSNELTALKELGWTQEDYSYLSEDNPIVHLTKDGNNAELMLKSSGDQPDCDVLLTMNGTTISLKGNSDLKETISHLEESAFPKSQDKK